ncbi:MAG: homocysteine S-methyltransferase family protein [Desulfatitalea sp.]|nr:homocysteine S-methyltransferase family protein [Desulfatitalea sp.]NNK02893.1 homocysteine S-methyltransferase family protein [Desulfatitalea sp.]
MIIDRLKNSVVLGDGGAIFELERRGYVSAGPFTPQVVVEHPEAVRQMQVDFARAGAEVLQAVTYYAHEEKLKDVGADGRLEQINADAVRIARQVADQYSCLVAGNLCNTWVYDPKDAASHAKARRQFDDQIGYQMNQGVDFFIAETIEYLGEAKIALAAIRAAGQPAMITLGFKKDDCTLDGVVVEDAFKTLEDLGADIVGINCFRDPVLMLPLARRMRDGVSCFTATQPVAYRCTPEKPYFQIQEHGGKVAFPLALDPFVLTRFEMARYALDAQQMGINFIGACCGAAPHHIRAMAEALGRTVPNSKYSPALDLHTIIGDSTHTREKNGQILCEQRYGKDNCDR